MTLFGFAICCRLHRDVRCMAKKKATISTQICITQNFLSCDRLSRIWFSGSAQHSVLDRIRISAGSPSAPPTEQALKLYLFCEMCLNFYMLRVVLRHWWTLSHSSPPDGRDLWRVRSEMSPVSDPLRLCCYLNVWRFVCALPCDGKDKRLQKKHCFAFKNCFHCSNEPTVFVRQHLKQFVDGI